MHSKKLNRSSDGAAVAPAAESAPEPSWVDDLTSCFDRAPTLGQQLELYKANLAQALPAAGHPCAKCGFPQNGHVCAMVCAVKAGSKEAAEAAVAAAAAVDAATAAGSRVLSPALLPAASPLAQPLP